MRRNYLFLVLLTLACTVPEQGTELSVVAPPMASSYNDPSRVDTDGLPDLIVDRKATENHWRVKNEIVPAEACSAQEGNVTPGNRRLLRFTVTTPNIGDADVFVGSPKTHVEANDGLFELATCHAHYHFQHYATYTLTDEAGREWRAAKRGFCMLDTDPYLSSLRDAPRNFRNCGNTAFDGFQGISKGWNDTYVWKLAGQYFVLDGGDGQPPVPAGYYYIKVEVNPGYAPGKKAGCPFARDPSPGGLCHQFQESSYSNNTMSVRIYIPAAGSAGPEKNSPDPTLADEIEHSGT